MVKVNIKWGKQKFDNVEVDVDESAIVFKSQLWTLTGVPPERQKIMVKGGVLKDDADLKKVGISEGQTLMMMGSADAVPTGPTEKVKFVEDMAPSELQSVVLSGYPAGLVNLQNTCYLNATVQCLKQVPELQTALKNYSNMSAAGAHDAFHNVTTAMRDLFGDLERNTQPVAPFRFVQTFRDAFPQFNERNPRGVYMQQDAEECWTQILVSLSQKLKDRPPAGAVVASSTSGAGSSAAGPSRSVIEHLFGGQLATTWKNLESEEEPERKSVDKFQKLSVHPQDTKFLHDGIRKSLEEDMEKRSETLGRDATYRKISRISHLPVYLLVQFVRFEWKQKEKVRAKILRDVAFPFVLDIFEFCTEELKSQLQPARDAIRERDDKLLQAKKAKADAPDPTDPVAPTDTPAPAAANGNAQTPAPADELTLEANVTGQYELIGVLTHMGRDADGGHYVAWIRQKKDEWLKFDDDTVTPVREEEIRKLTGGYGDWHIAYLCLYRSKNS